MSFQVETHRDPLITAQRRLSVQALQHIEAMHASVRAPGAPLSDAELAAQLARQEAESLEVFNYDRELARLLQETDDGLGALGGRNDAPVHRPLQNLGMLQRQPNAPQRARSK